MTATLVLAFLLAFIASMKFVLGEYAMGIAALGVVIINTCLFLYMKYKDQM